jgi:hypothetical protein
MGKARSTVASVSLSFLPRVGLVLQHLGLHRNALIVSDLSGVTGYWKFVFTGHSG